MHYRNGRSKRHKHKWQRSLHHQNFSFNRSDKSINGEEGQSRCLHLMTCTQSVEAGDINLHYNIKIYNRGRGSIYKTSYEDFVTYDEQNIEIGKIQTNPISIEVDTSLYNKMKLSGVFYCLGSRAVFHDTTNMLIYS